MAPSEPQVIDQASLASAEAQRLRGLHETDGIVARELYARLLAFLDRNCPAVFMELNGKTLHHLLRKGSMPVAGEALAQYRKEKAEKLVKLGGSTPPDALRDAAAHLLEELWSKALPLAQGEAREAAEVRNQVLAAQVMQLERTNSELLERTCSLERTLAHALAESDGLGARLKLMEEAVRVKESLLSDALRQISAEKASFETHMKALQDSLSSAQQAYEGASRRALLEVEAARQETKAVLAKSADLARAQVGHSQQIAMLEEKLGLSQDREFGLLQQLNLLREKDTRTSRLRRAIPVPPIRRRTL